MGAGTFRTVYLLLLVVTALIAAGTAVVAWRRRQAPGALPLSVLLWAQAWWSLCFALQVLPVPRPESLFWFKLMFAGVVVIPPAFLFFALEYTGRERWATGRTAALLAVEPVLLHLALWTDPLHGLFMGSYVSGAAARFVGGPAFWINALYSYVLLAVAIALIAQRALRGPALYRTPALIMLAGALAAVAANAVTILRLTPPPFDFTPIGFAIAGTVTAVALLRYRLLDLVPIARDAIVEWMTDAVLVLDPENRIIDVNRAAAALLRLDKRAVLGEPATAALAAWPEILARCTGSADCHDEVLLDRDGRYVDVRVTTLARRRGAGARLLVLRDVSHVKRIEAELRHANDRLRQKLAEIESLQGRLKEQIIRDPLTGLHNRRFLEESLARELASARRAHKPLGIALIDLDHFKRINDAHGHAAGDDVLVAIGDLLRLRARRSDIACRYGGEEFVVVMPGAGLESALQRIEEWREAFAALEVDLGALRVRTTFSAGVACFPQHGTSAEALLDAADQAMYAAKAAGRNRVVAARTTPLPA